MAKRKSTNTYKNITDLILGTCDVSFESWEVVCDGKEWRIVEKKNALQRLKERYGKKKV
jgi:hypothetical protein